MDTCENVTETLKVLGNPVRMRVLKHVAGVGCCVSDIEENLDLPQSTVSQHLSVLKRMGIVKATRNHKEVSYTLVNDFVKDLLELCCKYS